MKGWGSRLTPLLPVALGALVTVLAVLQYQWLGQVSEADRRQLRESLERRAQDFADDFDQQVGALYTALGQATGSDQPSIAASVGEQLAAWKERARFPQLIREIYLTDTARPRQALARFNVDRRSFDATTWPATLNPVLDRLSFAGDDQLALDRPGARTVMLGTSQIVTAIPALVLWLPTREPLPPPAGPLPTAAAFDVVLRSALTQRLLIVELDRDYVVRTMLPAVVARHFHVAGRANSSPPPAPGMTARTLLSRTSDVSVDVADAAGTSLFPEGAAPRETGKADVTTPFFRPRLVTGDERLMTWSAGTPAEGSRRAEVRVMKREVVADTRIRLAADAWELRLRHPAGSVDAAVTQARHRNLYLSFGILSVLAGAMALVVVNARRAHRLAAQQIEFVATVSHELRTPLTVIRSAAENIAAGIVQDPAQTRRYGELIESEGRRLTNMVEQVLAHVGINGHRRAARVAPVGVADTLHAVIAAMTPVAVEAGCGVECRVETGVTDVMADETGLRSAIENLLTNALKHGGAGGWVGVTARRVEAFVDRAQGLVVKHGVEIAVTDRGAGIEPRDRPHLFEPFFRGRRALEQQIKGSGLGLSLVKRTIEDMGGRVAAESPAEGGARFVIVLPEVTDERRDGAEG